MKHLKWFARLCILAGAIGMVICVHGMHVNNQKILAELAKQSNPHNTEFWQYDRGVK